MAWVPCTGCGVKLNKFHQILAFHCATCKALWCHGCNYKSPCFSYKEKEVCAACFQLPLPHICGRYECIMDQSKYFDPPKWTYAKHVQCCILRRTPREWCVCCNKARFQAHQSATLCILALRKRRRDIRDVLGLVAQMIWKMKYVP